MSDDRDQSGVFVPLAEADIERIEYEIEVGPNNEHSPETPAEWLAKAMQLEFARIDGETVYHSEVEVEVPQPALKRALLAEKSRRERGWESEMSMKADIEDRLLNDVAVDYRWKTTEGVGIDLDALADE